MNWSALISFIKSHGFTGDESATLEIVQSFLKSKGWSADELTDDAGATYSVKSLFDNRAGERLNVTVAAREAERQGEIDTAIDRAISRRDDIFKANRVEPGRENVRVRIADGEDPNTTWMGYKHLGEWAVDAARATPGGMLGTAPTDKWWHSQKGAPGDGLQTGEGSGLTPGGGTLVPTPFANQIMSVVFADESLAGRTFRMTTSAGSLTVPIDQTVPWDRNAGVPIPPGDGSALPIRPKDADDAAPHTTGELDAIVITKPQPQNVVVPLHMIAELVPVSIEMMEDSIIGTGQYITRKATEAIDYEVSRQILVGTGTGEAAGVVGHASALAIPRTTALEINFEDIVALWSRLYIRWRNQAVWVCNQTAEPLLMQMAFKVLNALGTDTTGGHSVYLPGGSVAGSPYGTLFGRPVIIHQACPDAADPGGLILMAPPQFLSLQKDGGIRADTSIHLYFDANAVAFRFLLRYGGRPWMNQIIPSASNAAGTSLAWACTLDDAPP